MRRRIDREWAAFLSPAEHKVVVFIYTITTEWGKDAERIKIEHFVHGLGTYTGTGLSSRTVRRAIKMLVFRGVVSQRRTPYGHVFAINFDWKRQTITVLKVPKKSVEARAGGLTAPKKPRESGQNDPSRVAKMTTPYTKGHTVQEHTNTRAAEAFEGEAPVGVLARRVQELAAAKLEKDKAKRASGKVSLEGIWRKAYHEAFPEAVVPVWAKRDKGQAQLFLRAIPASEPAKPEDVFEWVVLNWALIMNARFSWMTESGPPEFPAVGFMLAFKDKFYEAWNEKARLRIELNTSGADRKRRALMRRGLSHEEAQAEVEATGGIAQERERLAQQSASLNDMLRRVEARRGAEAAVERPATRVRSRPTPARPIADQGQGFGTLPGFDDE